MPPRRHTHARGQRRAAIVRACRAYAYLSTQELADLLGVSRSTVARWEAGEWPPTDDQIEAVAAVTQMPAWRMLLDDGDGLALKAAGLARDAARLSTLLSGDGFGDSLRVVGENLAGGEADLDR